MIDIEILTAVLKELGYLDDDEEKDTSEDSKHDRKEEEADS